MSRKRFLSGVAAIATAALALTACGGGSSAENGNGTTPGGSKTGGTLTLGVITPATTFAAADMFFANEAPYGQAVYDNLIKADPDGKLLPALATEWKYNDTQTVLTLTLRNDVTFTDGTKFNADVAAQNLKRFRDGTSPQKSYLASLQDAKAIDETHVELTLKQSDPALLTYLTRAAGYQASPAAFNKPDAKTNPVGSGPYILDTGATVVGSSYTFNKNPNYWDKGSQHYEKLVLKVFNDPTAMLNAVRGKQLNGAKLLNNDALDQVKAAGYENLPQELDWTGLMLLDRNGQVNPAFKDVRVRQAINYAFDKNALLQAVGKGYGTVTSQIFPTTSAGYDPALDSKYGYDPAKAKQLLAEAGYPNGFDLAMPSSTRVGTSLWALIQQQLKDVGINVTFTDAGTQFVADILAKKYAATWFSAGQDPADWALINFQISPNSTYNPFKITDPTIETNIAKYQAAKTDAEKAAAVKAINNAVVDNAWFAPWYRVKFHFAVDANTTVKVQSGNAFPYLWNFMPK